MAIDVAGVECAALRCCASQTTSDKILAQRDAQHASCHAVDREVDSRHHAVGRDACRLALELLDYRRVFWLEAQELFQYVRYRMGLRRVSTWEASVPWGCDHWLYLGIVFDRTPARERVLEAHFN